MKQKMKSVVGSALWLDLPVSAGLCYLRSPNQNRAQPWYLGEQRSGMWGNTIGVCSCAVVFQRNIGNTINFICEAGAHHLSTLL